MPENRLYRTFVFCGVSLWALFIFLIPSSMMPSDFESAEEQFTWAASNVSSAAATNAFSLQILGAVLVIPAAMGIVYCLQQQKRGVLLGQIGAGIALLGSIGCLVVLGMELAQFFVLFYEADQALMIELALAINNSAIFGLFLGVGLGGVFLGNTLLVISLLWARVIRWWALLFLLLPVVFGMLPIPAFAADVLSNLTVVALFAWIALSMLRTTSPRLHAAQVPAAA